MTRTRNEDEMICTRFREAGTSVLRRTFETNFFGTVPYAAAAAAATRG